MTDKLIRITESDVDALEQIIEIHDGDFKVSTHARRRLAEAAKRILASAERPVAAFEGKVVTVIEKAIAIDADPFDRLVLLDRKHTNLPKMRAADRIAITIEVLK